MDRPTSFAATAFFKRTYEEAHELLRESRDWLKLQAGPAARGLEPAAALVFAHETLRLTTRLTQVMAWLLAQRAAHAGEFDPAELREETWRLGARGLCLEPAPDAAEALPPALRALMARSEALYARIARLDDLMGRDAA